MPDWVGILLTILSIFIGGFALGVKYGESKAVKIFEDAKKWYS